MGKEKFKIPVPVATDRDRMAAFSLQQMEELGLVEKDSTLTQPPGYDILTLDKVIAPILAALYLYLGNWEHEIFAGISNINLDPIEVRQNIAYIHACKELAKNSEPNQVAKTVTHLLGTVSKEEKKRLLRLLKWVITDPGVRWFYRTYLDTKPIVWPEKISIAFNIHNKGKEIMYDESIPISERAKFMLDPSNIPVRPGFGEVVTIKCIKKSDLKKFKKIPTLQECEDLLVLCEVPLRWNHGAPTRTRDDIFYVSHKWDGTEPDPYQLIQLFLDNIEDDFLFWIDYCCIDQNEPDFEHIVSAISTIPHLRLLSMTTLYDHFFLGIISEQHSMSAWCQMEHALSKMFKRPHGLQLTKAVVLNSEQSVTTFLDSLDSLFFDREDVSSEFKGVVMDYCSELTLRLNSGKTHFFEEIDNV